MKKRLFSLLLCLLMVFSLLPGSAGAEWIEDGQQCEICEEWDEDCNVCDNCHAHMDGECSVIEQTHCEDCLACFWNGHDFCEECFYCDDCILDGKADDHCVKCLDHKEGDICDICHMCTDCEDELGYRCEQCSECIAGGAACHMHSVGDGVPHCESCASEYTCELCDECFWDSVDLFCTDCGLDFGCAAYLGLHCSECWGDEVMDEDCGLCYSCAIDLGLHCPECEACTSIFCESGGYHCILCCDDNGWFCPDCGECAEGRGLEICFYCGKCEECCALTAAEQGCSCGEVCVESSQWEEHICRDCEVCFDEAEGCEYCGRCLDCCLEDACADCGMCVENPDYSKHLCPDCGECMGDEACEYCGLCESCCQENSECTEGMCVEDPDYDSHFCDVCQECFDSVDQCDSCAEDGILICLTCCEADAHVTARAGDYAEIVKQPRSVQTVVPDPDAEKPVWAEFTVKVRNPEKCSFKWQVYSTLNRQYTDIRATGATFTGSRTASFRVQISTDACHVTQRYRCKVTDGTNTYITDPVEIVAEHRYENCLDTEKGSHALYCIGKDCGAVLATSYQTHRLGEWYITAEATSQAEGQARRDCRECGYYESKAIPVKHEHVWATKYSSSDNAHYYACTVEGCVMQKDAAAHSFGEVTVVTPATESSKGAGTKSCTVCGKTVETEINVLSHVHDFKEDNPDYIWSTNDYAKYNTYDDFCHWKICLKTVNGRTCKCESSKQVHRYTAWTLKENRTVVQRSCINCFYTQTKTLTGQDAADAQNSGKRFISVQNGSPSFAFAEPGDTVTITFTGSLQTGQIFYFWAPDICWNHVSNEYQSLTLSENLMYKTSFSYTMGDTDLVLRAFTTACSHKSSTHGSTWTLDQSSYVAPTCEMAGKEADYICTICKAVVQEGAAIEALGHDYALDQASVKAPTCSAYGYTGNTVCQREGCGKLESRGSKISRTEHSYGELQVITQPTCSSCGWYGRACTECGKTVRDTMISKTAHTPSSTFTTDQKPTETEAGIRHRVCTVCGAALAKESYTMADLLGDIDRNGVINLMDVSYLFQGCCGNGPTIPNIYGDVNGDGSVNLRDVVALYRRFMK